MRPAGTKTCHSLGLLALWLPLLMLLATPLQAAHAPALDLQGWEYRWGDAPFVDDEPLWARPDAPDSEQWSPIAFPSNPPDRQGREHVWFRITLPEVELHDPVLFIFSIDLIAEAYLDGRLLYRFGEFDAQGRGRFSGWPWHMIALPDDFAGRQIHFRVFSDYTDIGLWGEVKLFERSHLLHYLISHSYVELLVAAFCLFFALLALAFAMMRGDNRYFVWLGLFSLAAAGKLLGENEAVQLVIEAPLLRSFLTAASYYSLPVFMALLLSNWFSQQAGKLMRRVAGFHVVYLLAGLTLAAAGVIQLAHTFPVFDVLFTLSLLIMLGGTLNHFRQMNGEQRLVMAAFGVFAVLLLIDMAVAHGLLAWTRVHLSLGALLFVLALVLISLRHFSLTQQALAQMNETLEHKVNDRTASLQAYAEEEKRRSSQLDQINRYSHGLESLIGHLHASSDLQQAGLILCRDLPKVFAPASVDIVFDKADRPKAGERAIIIRDLNGDEIPYARCRFQASGSESRAAYRPLESFLDRVVERLGVTLSSIHIREALQRLSFEDALTGLKNRRFFDESLPRELQRAQRRRQPVSLLICDIDHFKQFNDRYGHEAGDVALRAVADVMGEHFRDSDMPCRLGGEEFVVLMPDATLADALARGQALRDRVAAMPLIYHGRQLDSLTVSIGIACWPGTGPLPESMLKEADTALYRAKLSGRNRVETT